MATFVNRFDERIAASHSYSFIVYPSDMPCHLLRVSLESPLGTVGAAPLVRKRGTAGLTAQIASHRRVRPAIPKNKFLEVP